MTQARQAQISLEATSYYHCISRCVRRAFLCGEDSLTGENYDHRKQWVVDRLQELTGVFAIDQNLILDYPRQAIEFAAASEAAQLDDGVRILPLREEQLKERLGDRFRELDVPLLLEWPDGRRQALLFVLQRLGAEIDLQQINSLVEDNAMLAENLETWAQRERQEGRQETAQATAYLLRCLRALPVGSG
jgi:hypothetical protein